jgi:hypothetical protein
MHPIDGDGDVIEVSINSFWWAPLFLLLVSCVWLLLNILILDRDMFVYHCYESLEQGRSFSLVVDGLIATSAYLEDLPQYIGSIDRRLSNACQTFCVSRYIAHTCRGRLKMSKREGLQVTTTWAHRLLSHRALDFHFILPPSDCCHIGALNWRLLSGMYVWTCKKFCRESNPGPANRISYVMKRQWNDYDYDP